MMEKAGVSVVRLSPEEKARHIERRAGIRRRRAEERLEQNMAKLAKLQDENEELRQALAGDSVAIEAQLGKAEADLVMAQAAAPLVSHETLVMRVRGWVQKKYAAYCIKLRTMGYQAKFIISMLRRQSALAMLLFGGVATVTCFDANGIEQWKQLCDPNLVVTEGFDHLLDVTFHNDTQASTWYIGLVNGASSPTYASTDTLASHAGWTEYTAYDETNRQEWTEGAASSASMTNGTSVDFSMNATGTVAGLLLASVSSGSSGTLWCGTSFSGGNQAVSNGDTLKVTYTLTASNA